MNRWKLPIALLALAAAIFALGGVALAELVQGVAAVNSSGTGIRPVLTGGLDGSGNLQADLQDSLGKRVHGVTTNGGSLSNVRPVVIGGTDGSVARSIVTDTSGRLYPAGTAEGSAPSGGPIQVGGKDAAGNMRTLPIAVGGASPPTNVLHVGGTNPSGQISAIPVVTDGGGNSAGSAIPIGVKDPLNNSWIARSDGSGVIQVSQWIGPRDTVIRLTPTASNGTTNVTIRSGSGSLVVYVASLFFVNADTVGHTITITDSAATDIVTAYVAAGGTGVVGENGGIFQTTAGAGLRFKIDAGGTGNTVTCSGAVVQK